MCLFALNRHLFSKHCLLYCEGLAWFSQQLSHIFPAEIYCLHFCIRVESYIKISPFRLAVPESEYGMWREHLAHELRISAEPRLAGSSGLPSSAGCALMCSPAPAMDLALRFVCVWAVCRDVGIVLLAWELPRLMYVYFTEPMGWSTWNG